MDLSRANSQTPSISVINFKYLQVLETDKYIKDSSIKYK